MERFTKALTREAETSITRLGVLADLSLGSPAADRGSHASAITRAHSRSKRAFVRVMVHPFFSVIQAAQPARERRSCRIPENSRGQFTRMIFVQHPSNLFD